jgi:uncharacterized protein YecT (DUF1311 family)
MKTKMGYLRAISLFALLCIAVNGNSQVKKDNVIDTDYKKCKDKDTTVANICDCAFIAYGKWNKEMDNSYDRLLRSLKKENEKTALKESQIAWKAYRDAEFNTYDFIFNIPGTKWCSVRQDGRVDMVRARALQLQEYYETLDKSHKK